MSENQERGMDRAKALISFWTGKKTVVDAAKELGISRNRFYELEKEGLQGLVEAMERKPSGRPSNPFDPEKADLLRQISVLENLLGESLRQLELKQLIDDMEAEDNAREKRHQSKKKKRRRKHRK